MMPALPRTFRQEVFWDGIPWALMAAENTFRVMVFALPFLMPIRLDGKASRRGSLLFLIGLLVYVASWLLLIFSPDSVWSRSAAGFLAPAYTPALWLGGLAQIGQRLYWGNWYRPWMYLVLCLLFEIAHVSHAALVYSRRL